MSGPAPLAGVLPAIVTPFTEDGRRIDEDALGSLVTRLAGTGIGGLVTCGSTGEFSALSTEERERVTEIVTAVAGAVPVVAHTGALTTAETIELSQHAERAGAAAIMVVPPFYEPPGWDELVAHYKAVAGSVSVPVMVYSIPAASGVKMTGDHVAELAAIPGVAMIKDSSGDGLLLMELIQDHSHHLDVFNGCDSLNFFALAAGARGSVWGLANFAPELAVELYRLLAVAGDLVAARSLWARLWPICHALDSANYAAGVKTACHLLGLQLGPLRAPLRFLEGASRRQLGDALRGAGLDVAEL
jgi:4-hydroxy-tetrahydrodipicolinate synthase